NTHRRQRYTGARLGTHRHMHTHTCTHQSVHWDTAGNTHTCICIDNRSGIAHTHHHTDTHTGSTGTQWHTRTLISSLWSRLALFGTQCESSIIQSHFTQRKYVSSVCVCVCVCVCECVGH